MKKNIEYYKSLNYSITIDRMEDGLFCASIPLLKGCKGYGIDVPEALEELEGVKETLIELLLEQGKAIPEPIVYLEIPVNEFNRMPSRKKLDQFVKNRMNTNLVTSS